MLQDVSTIYLEIIPLIPTIKGRLERGYERIQSIKQVEKSYIHSAIFGRLPMTYHNDL